MINNAEKYIKELKAQVPSLTPEEVSAKIEELTQKRIAEIRSTPTEVEIKGTTYYLSNDGDDTNDGKSPETAWKTIAKLNASKEIMAEGDGVMFRRGDLFRGTVSSAAGVTYSAYGEGDKPKIYVWDKNSADPALWKKTDVEGVWEYAEAYDIDIGAIIFDDTSYARKVYQSNEPDGRWLDFRAKREFHDYHDLVDDLSFWHSSQDSQGEEKTGKLYLRCNAGNPGEIYKDIEMNKKEAGIRVGGNGIHIDNLCIAHAGIHGIASGKRDGLLVTNCEIKWTGGTIQCPIRGYGTRSWPTPFGNAIEIYGEARNYTVDNCYIWQAYDAGVTHQGPSKGDLDVDNVNYINNVITDCVYAVEIFYGEAPAGEECTRCMKNTRVENNILRRGGGFGHDARPDEGVTALIRNGGILKNTIDYTVTNNIFDRSRERIVSAHNDGGSKAQYFDNIFVQNKGGKYVSRLGRDFMYTENLAEEIKETNTETGSEYVFVDEIGY
ncbi:MAG: right-handed parallel beta-helix repeat-containing protein [Clostridia bacterium]|nr:right-handed parallel beta-helix repeat-containing protein [Clostridia bacterium]